MDEDVVLGCRSQANQFSLVFLLLLVAIVAACLAIVVSSENKYHALCWLVPPIFILSRNHRDISLLSLIVRFCFAVVVWSILFFPAVFQDTEKWLAENEDWVSQTAGYDATNENLVAFFGFIPATIYSGLVVLVSCGITFVIRQFSRNSQSPVA